MTTNPSEDELWVAYGEVLGEYVASIDADDLDRIAARVCDLDQTVRAYANACVEAALASLKAENERLRQETGCQQNSLSDLVVKWNIASSKLSDPLALLEAIHSRTRGGGQSGL